MIIIRFVSFILALSLIVELFFYYLQPSLAAFARPVEIVGAIPDFIFNGGVNHIASTLSKSLLALFISIPVGLIIGLCVAKTPVFKRESKFVVDFLRSIPATALLPLLLIIFGVGDQSKIAAGVISGGLVIAIATIVGYEDLNPIRRQVANILSLRGVKRILFYEVPELFPVLLVGVRAAASLCLILVVIAEMLIGSEIGLGSVITDRSYSDDVPTLYLAIILTGVLGFCINLVLEFIEMRVRFNYSEH